MGQKKRSRKQGTAWICVCAAIAVVFVAFACVLTRAVLRGKEESCSSHLSESEITPAPMQSGPVLKGLIVNPHSQTNYFDFLLDTGERGFVTVKRLEPETRKLINYFFLGITLPSEDFWVNLNFAQKDRIISPRLGVTDMGRTLLEADLRLKKDTACLTDPRNPVGIRYWQILKEELGKLGRTGAPVPAGNRVWIVPGEAVVKEGEDTVRIINSSLTVCLESDYMENYEKIYPGIESEEEKELKRCAERAMEEAILPVLEYKVNYAREYAPLRQIYNSLILSECFKRKYWGKGSFFSHCVNQCYLEGLWSRERWSKRNYFDAYVRSVKAGEHSFYRSEYDPYQLGMVQRRYFSGGICLSSPVIAPDKSGTISSPTNANEGLILTKVYNPQDSRDPWYVQELQFRDTPGFLTASSPVNIIDYSDRESITDLPDAEWLGKTVLVSGDINLGNTSNLKAEQLTRVRAIIPDLKYLLDRGVAKIVLISHNADKKDYKVDRKDGEADPAFSLRPVAGILTGLLHKQGFYAGKEVLFADDCIGEKTKEFIETAEDGSIIIPEQTRFYAAETSKEGNQVEEFARKIQETVQADIFVMAAAGALHRGQQASKGVVAKYINGPKVTGLLVKKELDILYELCSQPKRPVVAVMGGSKLEGKIKVMKNLVSGIVDKIVVVGKMAYPFVNKEDIAREITAIAKENNVDLVFPEQIIAARVPEELNPESFINLLKKETPENLETKACSMRNIPPEYIMLDVSPADIVQKFNQVLLGAQTVIINGTAGLNENELFAEGTNAIIDTALRKKEQDEKVTLLALGGDGVSAILSRLGQDRAEGIFDLISTMGGSALVYLSGESLSAMKWIDRKPAVSSPVHNEVTGIRPDLISSPVNYVWAEEIAQRDKEIMELAFSRTNSGFIRGSLSNIHEIDGNIKEVEVSKFLPGQPYRLKNLYRIRVKLEGQEGTFAFLLKVPQDMMKTAGVDVPGFFNSKETLMKESMFMLSEAGLYPTLGLFVKVPYKGEGILVWSESLSSGRNLHEEARDLRSLLRKGQISGKSYRAKINKLGRDAVAACVRAYDTLNEQSFITNIELKTILSEDAGMMLNDLDTIEEEVDPALFVLEMNLPGGLMEKLTKNIYMADKSQLYQGFSDALGEEEGKRFLQRAEKDLRKLHSLLYGNKDEYEFLFTAEDLGPVLNRLSDMIEGAEVLETILQDMAQYLEEGITGYGQQEAPVQRQKGKIVSSPAGDMPLGGISLRDMQIRGMGK